MKKTSLFNSILLILIGISCLFYIVYGGLNLKGMTSLIFIVLGFVNLLTVKNDVNKEKFIICLFIGLITQNPNYLIASGAFAIAAQINREAEGRAFKEASDVSYN